MLSRRQKIKDKAALARVFERGIRVRLETRAPNRAPFSLKYAKRAEGGVRFAIAIPKELKLAPVARNKTRRRLFEAIGRNLAFTKNKNYDIVITVHRRLDRFDFDEIQAVFTSLVEKIS